MSAAPDALSRRSPIQAWLEARRPSWRLFGDAQLAISFRDPQAERGARATLGICDLSVLAKLGLKGRAAADWLQAENLPVPENIYDTLRLGDRGIIARLAADEFLLESGLAAETVLAPLTVPVGQVYRFPREDATFLLVGSRAEQVLAQTCGYNFGPARSDRVVLTRVAGTSCAVLPQSAYDFKAYRLWVDFSYAGYLWEKLVEIVESLEGSVVGAACVLDEL